MNFCGACGTPLDASDRASGICHACGAVLDPSTPPGFTTAPASRPAPSWGGAPATRMGWHTYLLLGVLALVVLGGIAEVVLITHSRPPSGTPPTVHNAGSATQTAVASPSIQGNPTTIPPSVPTSTPGSGPGPAATATPSPNPIVTITATALPALSVNPTQINAGICAAKPESFTVTNSGGGSLTWTASTSTLAYGISPASGTLSGGQQTTVNVSNIVKSGSVNVEAPGAQGSPQTVTITCTGTV